MLLVVMGLPAAGKSTLARALDGIHVRFDDDLDDDFDVERWHESRRASLNRVRAALATDAKLVIADDNCQYRSMRHTLFKLARDASCAFATVFVDVDVEEALRRNARRDDKVPEVTIRRMASQLEPPDPSSSWERHSIVSSDVDAVYELVRRAESEGPPPKPLSDEQRDEDRRQTKLSKAHAFDLGMRKLVGDVVKSDAVKTLSKKQRALVTSALAHARKTPDTFVATFRDRLASDALDDATIATLVADLESRYRVRIQEF